MEKVYLLEHYYEDDEHEDTKYIGVFSDKKKAKKALKKVKNKPGFNKFPEGFCISEIIINKSSWAEGFIYYESDEEYMESLRTDYNLKE